MAQAHLLIMYPTPKDPKAFDRVYREEHLPFAGPRLAGALGVVSKRVKSPGSTWYAVSDVTFPSLAALQDCAESAGAKAALEHAASISSGGAPTVLVITDDLA